MVPFEQFLMLTARLIAWLFLLTAIFVPLEMFFSVRKQPVIRKDLLPDIGYFFLGGLMKAFLISFVMGLVAGLSRLVIPAGYFQFVSSLPVLVQIAAALVVGEIGFYWSHRMVHAVPALWNYHAVHHEPERMDWLVNTRMHPVDLIFTRVGGLALVTIAGLGVQDGGTNPMIAIIVLLTGTIWAFYIHSNVRWNLGWFEHVLSSARFHHWHHSRDDHPNHNFASMLPIFDRVFGTLHMPPGQAWPPSYGIAPENEPGTADEAAAPEKPQPDRAQAAKTTVTQN